MLRRQFAATAVGIVMGILFPLKNLLAGSRSNNDASRSIAIVDRYNDDESFLEIYQGVIDEGFTFVDQFGQPYPRSDEK